MPQPDCQRIAHLERELGIGQVEPERRAHSCKTVCLIKNCGGTDYEIRTWAGPVVRRVHQH
ncbi:hypothetical protein ACWF76_05580 [Streptomyces globisporus]